MSLTGSTISWPHHLKRSDHVPVTALRIVVGLSNGISRGQAFHASLFGHNVLVANHDEDLGVSHHCKCLHAAILGEETLMKSVADSGHSCQTQRSDSKKSRICTLGNGFERLRGQAVRPKI